ncbi:MAG: hypothetical protein RIS00_900, partial [Pseudomonadota bacterium]
MFRVNRRSEISGRFKVDEPAGGVGNRPIEAEVRRSQRGIPVEQIARTDPEAHSLQQLVLFPALELDVRVHRREGRCLIEVAVHNRCSGVEYRPDIVQLRTSGYRTR